MKFFTNIVILYNTKEQSFRAFKIFSQIPFTYFTIFVENFI